MEGYHWLPVSDYTEELINSTTPEREWVKNISLRPDLVKWTVSLDSELLYIKTDLFLKIFLQLFSPSWENVVLTEGRNQLSFLGSFQSCRTMSPFSLQIFTPQHCNNATSKNPRGMPWPAWLSVLSAIWQNRRSLVRFPERAQTRAAGKSLWEATNWWRSLSHIGVSLPLFLPRLPSL